MIVSISKDVMAHGFTSWLVTVDGGHEVYPVILTTDRAEAVKVAEHYKELLRLEKIEGIDNV